MQARQGLQDQPSGPRRRFVGGAAALALACALPLASADRFPDPRKPSALTRCTLVIPMLAVAGSAPLRYQPAPPDNPLKGFVPYLRADATFPHSLEWDYTKLSDVMTGPTNFNWAPFEAKLSAAASRGHQFFARFYLEWPGRTTGVPPSLLAAGVRLRTWTNTNTQPGPPAVDNADYGKILVYSRKWNNGELITTYTEPSILAQMRDDFEQADLLVGYNSRLFDVQYANTRLLEKGRPPLPKKHHFDMYFALKGKLRTTSKSMGAVGSFLGLEENKLGIPAKPWRNFDNEALTKRCQSHVLLLDQLYHRSKHLVVTINT